MITRRVFAVLVAVLVVTLGCGDEVPVVEPEPVVTTTTTVSYTHLTLPTKA